MLVVVQVTNERKWREVTEPFSFPPTATSASFVLRKFYINLLHHFEQVYFLRNTGALVPPPGEPRTRHTRMHARSWLQPVEPLLLWPS